MKRYISVFSILLFSALCFAQPVNNLIGDVQMKPPGIASLARYEDIPVSFFTGTPNISIPIYEVVEGTISFPLALSYHSSGHKVAETSSWVGLGWSLTNGGSGFVSRTTQGFADDRSGGYYLNGAPDDPCDNSVCNQDTLCTIIDDVLNGRIDPEPDIYHFQFGGRYSGKFFFDAMGTPVLVPNQDIKIEPIKGNIGLQNFGDSAFRGWKFITPDGSKYYFGGYSSTPTADLAVDDLEVQGQREISTWYLIRMTSYDEEYAIDFEYVDEDYRYRSPATCQRVSVACYSEQPFTTDSGSDFNCFGFNGADFQLTRVRGQRLSRISSRTCTVDFIAQDDRLDLEPFIDNGELPNQLDRIDITTGDYCKRFELYQSYFETGSVPLEDEDRRLRLDSLQEIACDGSVNVAPYTFDYNTNQTLPNRLSRQIDHWGYFNRKLNNEGNPLNIPFTVVPFADENFNDGGSVAFGNSNREPDSTFVKAAMLDQINYPEGGFTKFDYEQHEWYNSSTTDVIQRNTLANLSNCTVPDINCCGSQITELAGVSFTDTEIMQGKFSLSATTVEVTGASCGNPNAEVIIKFVDSVGNVNASVGFNLMSDESIAPIPEDLSSIIGLVDFRTYTLRLETLNTKGEFNAWREEVITTTAGNEPVGGLRIRQITHHDGIDTDRDIIKTYEYQDNNIPTQSSGVLFKPPQYGYPLYFSVVGGSGDTLAETYYAVFSSTSITPLADFEGYAIGYKSVKEKLKENGSTTYNYRIEPPPFSGTINVEFPVPPTLASVRNGTMTSMGQFRENGTSVATTLEQQHSPSSNYVEYTNSMFKLQSVGAPSNTNCSSINAVQCYKMRTGQYLVGTVNQTLDGVTTSMIYDYDNNLDHLAPTIEEMTNSDGKVYRTEYSYVFDSTSIPIYADMVDSNIIAQPLQVKQFVITGGNSVQTKGSATEFAFFDSNGEPYTTTNNGTDDMYPFRLHEYRMTFDESNNPINSYYELEAAIEKRFPSGTAGKAGYPEIAHVIDWNFRDTFDYENGILTYHRFGDHIRRRDLHPNTRMTASQTDIDGQPVFFNYDQLMRVDTILARPKVGVANPSPQQTNDFNVVTTAEYIYPQTIAPDDRAYVRTRIDYAPDGLGYSDFDFRESFAYADGLGRLIQTVEREHSTDSLDVVIAQEYDNRGRVYRVYEPFKSTNDDGSFVPTLPSLAQQVFTETDYWGSPLDRVIRATPPDWYATRIDYESNVGNEVQDLQNGGFFVANSLNKQIVTDPEQNRTITFTDKRGRVVMTRRDSIGGSEFIETYRLYDDKDRPTTVVPPDATLSDANLIYSYLYNEDDQVIEQKIPDKAKILMQYNERELLTAMQDGNMRDSSRWLVSNYDDYGRIIRTGFFQDLAGSNPPSTENPAPNNGTLTQTFYDGGSGIDPMTDPIYYGRIREIQSALLDGYRPETSLLKTMRTRFTYDDYGRLSSENSSVPESALNTNVHVQQFDYDFADNITFRQRNHGSSVAALSDQTILEQMFYDHKGRLVDAFHEILGQPNEHCTNLEYGVRDLVTRRKLGGIGNNDFLQWVDYRYNAQRWLTQINSELPIGTGGGGDDELLNTEPLDLFYMKLNYDDGVGAINSSQERSGNISNVVWQTLGEERRSLYGYRYDFLDRIRRATYGTENSTQQFVTDDFGASYVYDARGNITTLMRKANIDGTIGMIDELAYTYASSSNQIEQIQDASTAGEMLEKACCIEDININEVVETDENFHADYTLTASSEIDSTNTVSYKAGEVVTLTAGFSYKPSSGQSFLARVEPCNDKVQFGFEDVTNVMPYSYDSNGNLVVDTDKGITISYNHLNLPYRVDFGGGKSLTWLYDASGKKWQMVAEQGNNIVDKRNYYDEIEYNQDSIESIYHVEGRAAYNGTDWDYHYAIRDQTNNTRVVFQDDGSGEAEILTSAAYYPFGLPLDTLSTKSSPLYRYLYNDQEQITEFGLNWIDFGNRLHDPAAPRFTTIDRFAEKYVEQSPYAYAANNPILYIDINGDSLDIGGNMEASFEDILSLLPRRFRDRVSYDKETGKVSFNVDGLQRNKDGGIKGSQAATFLEKITNSQERYLYENTESYVVMEGTTKVIAQEGRARTYVLENLSEKTVSTENFPDNITSIIPYSPLASGNLKGEVTTSSVIPTYNSVPRDGYDGQVAVHPDIYFPTGTNYKRRGVVKHAIREVYFRTTEGLSYPAAHRKAGGQSGFPAGTMVGNRRH